MSKSSNLRLPIISKIEKALKDQPTNVVIHDSKDKELIYDLAKYFRTHDTKYAVRVGPHNDQYCLIVERLS